MNVDSAELASNVPLRPRRSKVGPIVGGAVVVVLLLGVGAFFLFRDRTSTASDSGVVGCKALLSISISHSAVTNPTKADLRRYGADFAGSRFGDLRSAGVKYVDSYLLMQRTMSDDGATSQAFMSAAGDTMKSSKVLDTACAVHGVALVGSGDTPETEGCESGGPFLKSSDATMFSDQQNAIALKADASAAIDELTKDIGTTADPQAEADLHLTLNDYRKLLADASSSTVSSGDLQQDRSRIAVDAGNVEDDCDPDS